MGPSAVVSGAPAGNDAAGPQITPTTADAESQTLLQNVGPIAPAHPRGAMTWTLG